MLLYFYIDFKMLFTSKKWYPMLISDRMQLIDVMS